MKRNWFKRKMILISGFVEFGVPAGHPAGGARDIVENLGVELRRKARGRNNSLGVICTGERGRRKSWEK